MASTRRSESGASNAAAISSTLGTLIGVARDGVSTDAATGAVVAASAVAQAIDDVKGEIDGVQATEDIVSVVVRVGGAFGLKHERGGVFGEGARQTALQREEAKWVRVAGGLSVSLSLVSLSLTNTGMSLNPIGPGLSSTSPQSLRSS